MHMVMEENGWPTSHEEESTPPTAVMTTSFPPPTSAQSGTSLPKEWAQLKPDDLELGCVVGIVGVEHDGTLCDPLMVANAVAGCQAFEVSTYCGHDDN
jgi:hypothetical protein